MKTQKSTSQVGNPSKNPQHHQKTQDNPTHDSTTRTPAVDVHSWADKVRVTDSSTRCSLENLPKQPYGSRLLVPSDMLKDNSSQWKRCLVGFFPGARMPYHTVKSIADRVWRPNGLEQTMSTENGFYLFRFRTEEDLQGILERGPWMFGGKSLIIQQWHPHIQFDKNRISTVPVWVRLRGLPFPLWTRQGLSLAASMVGRPLSCDELTSSCRRLDFARVCVEVDATHPYVHRFEIDSELSQDPIVVEVDYEWKPSRCKRCKVYGHACQVQETMPEINAQEHATNLAPTVEAEHNGLKGKESQVTLIPQPNPTSLAQPGNPQPAQSSKSKPKALDQTQSNTQPTDTIPQRPISLSPDDSQANQPLPKPKHKNTPAQGTSLLPPLSTGKYQGKSIQDEERLAISTVDSNGLPECTESKMDSLGSHSSATIGSEKSVSMDDTGTSSDVSKGDKGCWNSWGLNSHRKHSAVQEWTSTNGLHLIGLIEPRLESSKILNLNNSLGFQGWNFVGNGDSNNTSRILVGWNTCKYSMQITESAPQWITCQASDISNNESIFISFVYGHNNPADRKCLWDYLQRQSSRYALQPWVILGDFNAILSTNDRMGGSQQWPSYMDDFHSCLQQASLINVPYSGIHLTWHNGQKDGHTIQKKLDWILGNQELFNRWPRAHAKFLPRMASDHSPMLIHLDRKPRGQRPQAGFKFLNLWTDRPEFLDFVSNVWGQAMHGNPIFRITSKLQVLRSHLKRYHKRNTSRISARVKEAKNTWSNGQALLNERPLIRNRIQSLSIDDGHMITDHDEIHQHAVHYYEKLLKDDNQGVQLQEVQEDYQKRLSEEDKANMTLPVTAEEIKAALFSIPDGKSPGPDGYTSCFFKKSW
ncbi:hypothetical protein OIU78_001686, partial [Salix suchowensis]